MRQKKIDIGKALIDEMFRLAGHQLKFEDIKDRKDNWYQQYTITEEQNKDWVEWGAYFIRKTTKVPKEMAEREMAMFSLNYGLKIKQ